MRVVLFNFEQRNIDDIVELCKTAEDEKSKAASDNMKHTDWQTNSASLLYILLKGKRFHFNNGLFTCLYDNDQLVAVSGCYRSEFDKDVIIGGVRAWVIPQYRAKYVQSNYLLKTQKEWTMENNAKAFALTFDDYNLKLMQIITRDGKYETKAVKGVGHTRPDFYNSFIKLPEKIIIQNTPQWVMYQKFDEREILWP
jgi:hypothetical protein